LEGLQAGIKYENPKRPEPGGILNNVAENKNN
jgi:hypothetical protein